MTILLFVMLGVFVFMMFRRNKKTQQQQAQLQSKFGPGVEVMTSFGLFGRIVDIDEAENKVDAGALPGQHRHRAPPGRHQDRGAGCRRRGAHGRSRRRVLADHREAGRRVTDSAPVHDAPRTETPEETLRRLNDEGKKDS